MSLSCLSSSCKRVDLSTQYNMPTVLLCSPIPLVLLSLPLFFLARKLSFFDLHLKQKCPEQIRFYLCSQWNAAIIMAMNTILHSVAFTTNPWYIFLANITGCEGSQTKTTFPARFPIIHTLEDTNVLLLELAKVIL